MPRLLSSVTAAVLPRAAARLLRERWKVSRKIRSRLAMSRRRVLTPPAGEGEKSPRFPFCVAGFGENSGSARGFRHDTERGFSSRAFSAVFRHFVSPVNERSAITRDRGPVPRQNGILVAESCVVSSRRAIRDDAHRRAVEAGYLARNGGCCTLNGLSNEKKKLHR